ncbi:MAG TPA: fumarylacetoacetate hydrolase family protein [Stellaceae bacterium]|nr:fumarylacetoacetate hydrolase family protein [Stellaceae bacterium]
MTKSESIARYFYEIHRDQRHLPPLPPELMPRDFDEAYTAQEALHSLFISERGPIAGYKISTTTPVMQKLMGIDRPTAGAIFRSLIHRSPARLALENYHRVAVECEIAMRLQSDLPGRGDGRPYQGDELAESVEACFPAIEIIEDHGADYKKTNALGLIANNAWNLGCVLGPARTDWRALDLREIEGRMVIGGREIGKGVGRDVLGHPLNALAWVANIAIERRRPLRAGMVVLTGSIVSTQWPKSGELVEVRFSGLGAASVTFITNKGVSP